MNLVDQQITVILARGWLAENFPSLYSPELTDEEVKSLIIEIGDELVSRIKAIVDWMDEHVPEWRDILASE